MPIFLKRAYEPPAPGDGVRILVDRLWPRGIARSTARIDLWLRDIAPSTGLRQWFGHDPSKWAEFRDRYLAELGSNPAAVGRLAEQLRLGTVTLVYGAKDERHNHALVLKEYLQTLDRHSPVNGGA